MAPKTVSAINENWTQNSTSESPRKLREANSPSSTIGLRQVELALDRRERDAHDRRVEHHHRERSRHRREDQPAVPAFGRHKTHANPLAVRCQLSKPTWSGRARTRRFR